MAERKTKSSEDEAVAEAPMQAVNDYGLESEKLGRDRKIGREPRMNDPEKAITFLSFGKELLLFLNSSYYIKFENHQYITDNEKDIAILRKHPGFKRDFWEGKFPDEVIKRFEEDKKWVTEIDGHNEG